MNRVKNKNSVKNRVKNNSMKKVIKQAAKNAMESIMTTLAEEQHGTLNREQIKYIELISKVFSEHEDTIKTSINAIKGYIQFKKDNIDLFDEDTDDEEVNDEEIKLIIFDLTCEHMLEDTEGVQLFLEQIERRAN